MAVTPPDPARSLDRELPVLPEWLVAELPPVEPHGMVDVDGPTRVVYRAPDGSEATFVDVVAAFEALREVDLEFSDGFLDREGALGPMVFLPADRSGSRTIWSASNDALSLERLRRDFADSLAWAQAYHVNGGLSFLDAFRYLDTHAAFWFRRVGDSRRSRWFWETSGHVNRVELRVWPEEDGSVTIRLETGMHTPDMTEHFHDMYLDADGSTFENAVLTLARNVAITFKDDGTETGEKPSNPWADEVIATLRDRVADLPGESD